jgi:hypothetical protein
MSNFIIDGTSLPYPKQDLVPLGSAPANKYVTMLDWNTVCQALVDVQGLLRGNFKLFKTGDTSVSASLLVSQGPPLMTAVKGSLCVDVTTPTLYQNQDGASLWTPLGGGGGAPTCERLSTDGAANPVVDRTFVSGIGVDLTLANGTIDGFIKSFIITSGSGTITPANLADGDVLSYSAAPANVDFIWDAVGGTWHVHGNPYNMVTT